MYTVIQNAARALPQAAVGEFVGGAVVGRIVILVPRSYPQDGNDLVAVERFLGCAESAVLVLSKKIKSLNIM